MFYFYLVFFMWFVGMYVLLMVDLGCFEGGGFIWYMGYWIEELERDENWNRYFLNIYLKIKIGNLEIECYFCVKNLIKVDKEKFKWLNGKYCIYKKGDFCL